MNLEEILKQLNELEKKDVRDLEVDENIELEKGCICGSCRELNGLSISTKSITDLDFPFTKIIHSLVERVKAADEILKHVSSCGMNDCDCMEAPLYDYMEKWGNK